MQPIPQPPASHSRSHRKLPITSKAKFDGSSSVPIAELTAGLILDEEVRTGSGLLIAAKGQEITVPLLLKLKTFAAKQHIPNDVVVCPAKQP